MKVSSSSSVSSVNDEVEIEKTGKDITIAFNCKYLLDALRAISDDKVKISLSTPLLSILIEPTEKKEGEDEGEEKKDEGKFLYMVCPVKLKE